MKLEPLQPEWINDEAKAQFDAIQELRDEAITKMHIQLGDLPQPSTISATEIHRRQITDPRRRADIEAAWRPVLDGYAKAMADLVGKFTTPRALIIDENGTN